MQKKKDDSRDEIRTRVGPYFCTFGINSQHERAQV